MTKRKKILIFTLSFFLLLIIGLTSYFLLKKPKVNINSEKYHETNRLILDNEEIIDNVNNNLNISEDKNNNKIADINIDQAQMLDGKIYFYSKDENIYGRINVTEGKNTIEILLRDLPILSEVLLSSQKDKLLYKEFESNSYFVYDFNAKEKIKLNENIKTALWYPLDKNKIIGAYSTLNKNNINIYNTEDNKREEIINLFVNSGSLLGIASDGKNLLYTFSEPNSFLGKEIEGVETELGSTAKSFFVLFDITTQKTVLRRENIDRGKFSPDNKKLLISKPGSGPYPAMAILNLENFNESPLNLGTYLDRVEFIDGSNLIYAKIEGIKESFFQSTLWKYNIDTNKYSRLTEIGTDKTLDINNIMTSVNGQKIYFINNYDKKIYLADINK